MSDEIERAGEYAKNLQVAMRSLLNSIGNIPIGKESQFPFGWRKAAKGRTVWRLLEEVVSQNLENSADKIGLDNFKPAESEVGVYDFSFQFQNSPTIYVNVKSAVAGGRTNKDDISKAPALYKFVSDKSPCFLLIATIEIKFIENPLSISLNECYVVPTLWLPDIYVNPSNNGNLQSSKYKSIEGSIPRTREQFLEALEKEMGVAAAKRAAKRAKN